MDSKTFTEQEMVDSKPFAEQEMVDSKPLTGKKKGALVSYPTPWVELLLMPLHIAPTPCVELLLMPLHIAHCDHVTYDYTKSREVEIKKHHCDTRDPKSPF
jgi:hypothetical protein